MRLIAGPCVHESYLHSYVIANHCKEVAEREGFDYYLKASYDKANRSSASGKRGVGLERTMEDFAGLKAAIPNLKILTDVHTVEDIEKITRYGCVDVIQIPAFLCRQTDLVAAACKTDMIVNIKKGQFLAPWDMKGILSKCESDDVWITERGSSFGYNNLVVDFTGIRYMLENYKVPVIMDATHSVQKPGGLGGSSGGNREYAPHMAYAAAACGVKDFFFEVHDDPDNAPSDGPNMIKMVEFSPIIRKLKQYIEVNNGSK